MASDWLSTVGALVEGISTKNAMRPEEPDVAGL